MANVNPAKRSLLEMRAEFNTYARDVKGLMAQVKAEVEAGAKAGTDAGELAKLSEQYTYLEAELQWAEGVVYEVPHALERVNAYEKALDDAPIVNCGCPTLTIPSALMSGVDSQGATHLGPRTYLYTQGTANDGPLYAQVDISVHPGIFCDEKGLQVSLFAGVGRQGDYFTFHNITGNLLPSFFPEQLALDGKATFDNGQTVAGTKEGASYTFAVPKGAKALASLELEFNTGRVTTDEGGQRIYEWLKWK
jgi:hypothetical protein